MNPGIILASYPVSPYAIDLGRTFIQLYEEYFPDATLYVGINFAGFNNEWIEILNNTKLRVYYQKTPDHLIRDSDASAYQTALRLFKEHGEEHDLLWFNHFKSSNRPDKREITDRQMNGLIRNRINIEVLFREHPDIGLYALEGWPFDHNKMDIGGEEDNTTQYFNFPYSIIKITPIYTFYTIRAIVVKNFLNSCNESFLEQRIESRFFFENDFCQIIFRQGYVPYIEKCILDSSGYRVDPNSRARFDNKITEWKRINNIKDT